MSFFCALFLARTVCTARVGRHGNRCIAWKQTHPKQHEKETGKADTNAPTATAAAAIGSPSCTLLWLASPARAIPRFRSGKTICQKEGKVAVVAAPATPNDFACSAVSQSTTEDQTKHKEQYKECPQSTQ